EASRGGEGIDEKESSPLREFLVKGSLGEEGLFIHSAETRGEAEVENVFSSTQQGLEEFLEAVSAHHGSGGKGASSDIAVKDFHGLFIGGEGTIGQDVIVHGDIHGNHRDVFMAEELLGEVPS